jgi:RNA polymerase sigma-70 factor (ECF subfamily)
MPNNETLSDLFIAMRGSLIRMVSRIVPPKEIEDIVQETYVRVCQVKKQDTINYPRAFLVKTARNLAIDYAKRAESRLSESLDDDTEYGPGAQYLLDETYEQVATDEEFAHFCEAVRQLPLQCRRAFVLKKVYGYSQEEIAQQLDISVSTVAKHVTNGIKRCTYYMMIRQGQGSEHQGGRVVPKVEKGGDS